MPGSENSTDSSAGRIKDKNKVEFLLPGMMVYTSAGAGTWGPPMRVDTNPDIVAIKFE
jgi:predicted MPP superfamily phosphohydrolase